MTPEKNLVGLSSKLWKKFEMGGGLRLKATTDLTLVSFERQYPRLSNDTRVKSVLASGAEQTPQ